MSETTTVQTEQGVVVVQIAPPAPDPAVYADYTTLATYFLVAAVAIFCARQLLNLFTTDPK